MDSYRIIMTPDAANDMTELRDYIANVLRARKTALDYVRFIRQEIGTLAEMPTRNKPVDGEPWHSLAIRRMIAKTFTCTIGLRNPKRKCIF